MSDPHTLRHYIGGERVAAPGTFQGVNPSSYGPREQGTAAIEFYTQVKTAYTWA
jgi:acyl-CoA reductase-like NAD-dependent aldehyde dehydrogenase